MIHIEDTPYFYDLSVFNRCVQTGNVLLTIECWQEVYPGLLSIPVNWDCSIPYRLRYSLHAPEDVQRFVQTADPFWVAKTRKHKNAPSGQLKKGKRSANHSETLQGLIQAAGLAGDPDYSSVEVDSGSLVARGSRSHNWASAGIRIAIMATR